MLLFGNKGLGYYEKFIMAPMIITCKDKSVLIRIPSERTSIMLPMIT